MDTVAAVRLLPQPLWSATEISQEAARIQNDAQQDHYTSLIDAAEISSFVTCMVTAAAKRWNFDVYSQSIGSNLALLNQDGTRGICLSAATSIDSDKPEAAQAKGGWTQRQVDIELAYCSATTKNSAVCPCQVNVLSKNWSYVYIRLLSDVHYAAFMTSDAQLKACQ